MIYHIDGRDYTWTDVAALVRERDALARERDGLRLAPVATSEQGDTLAARADRLAAERREGIAREAALALVVERLVNEPAQPLYTNEHGTRRFKMNPIVRHLLDNGPFDLNQIALMGFSDDDQAQFAQLIGYSLSGWGELSYVSDAAYERATLLEDTTTTAPDAAPAALLQAARAVQELVALKDGPRDAEYERRKPAAWDAARNAAKALRAAGLDELRSE